MPTKRKPKRTAEELTAGLPVKEVVREADARDLALALPGAGAAVEKALLEALTEEARKTLEKEYLPYTHNLRVIDVTRAQEALLASGAVHQAG